MAKTTSKPVVDILAGKLLYDKVLVTPIVIKESKGIYTPQQYEDKLEFGKVVMIGEGRLMDNGTVVPSAIKKGDTVYFNGYSATKLRVEGVDYLLIREDDIDWTDAKGK